MPPAAGAFFVGTVRSSRGGADAGGADCSIGAGRVGGATICGGTASAGCAVAGAGGGAADEASRDDHGRNKRSTAATRTTAPVTTHWSKCDGSPWSWIRWQLLSRNRRWPVRIGPRRGGVHFPLGVPRWRGDGEVRRWPSHARGKSLRGSVGLPRSSDGRTEAPPPRWQSPCDRASRPRSSFLFFRRRWRGCSGYWQGPDGADPALLPECGRRFSATHQQTQGRQPLRRVPPAPASDERPAVQSSLSGGRGAHGLRPIAARHAAPLPAPALAAMPWERPPESPRRDVA